MCAIAMPQTVSGRAEHPAETCQADTPPQIQADADDDPDADQHAKAEPDAPAAQRQRHQRGDDRNHHRRG